MENNMKRICKPLWLISTSMVIFLSACGGTAKPTEIANVDAIYTQAASTVAAKLTQTASIFTSTPESLATTQIGTLTPLITNTPELTNTPFVLATQVPPTQASCDNSLLISDLTIPDGTEIAPGAKFVKSWRLQNNGQCSWNVNYHLSYSYSSDSWKTIKENPPVAVKLSEIVAPGGYADISITLTAPTASGMYSAYFYLANDKGYIFGTLFWVTIQVGTSPTP
jgi:hypothetical protein